MHLVFPFHSGDIQQAERWMGQVGELGGCRGHSITLMPAKKVADFSVIQQLAEKSFDSVSILPDAEGIEGHPEGPNSNMRQAIWHCQVSGIGPWTFMEPDCIPLVSGWLDEWEREYRAFGKPFMGEFRPGNGTTPDYLTGNMVLPKDALMLAPMLARRGLSKDGVELAFDIVGAAQTLPHAHLTKLLQQVPKNPDGSSATFPDQASLSILREGAVLFHPVKDGSLEARLREKRTPPGKIAPVSATNAGYAPATQYLSAEEVAKFRSETAPEILRASLSDTLAPKTITDQIRSLCVGLSKLSDGKPARKQMVHRELRAAGIIGSPKARKKRKRK